MAHQPNMELDPEDLPRGVPVPSPPRRWTPASKPGVITAPEQMPWGGEFGTPGPDTGYALLLIEQADIPELTGDLKGVLVALMSARASAFGRAPIRQDLDAALLLAGIGEGLPEWLSERRKRWLAHADEKGKVRIPVAEIDPELLKEPPERIRYVLSRP